MILNTFTENEVLNELIKDYKKDVKPYIRKNARKNLSELNRRTAFGESDEWLIIKFTTNLNNDWAAIIDFKKDGQALWTSSCCCIVEGKNRTKDYYILRGLKDSPYFVKISSHAIKRAGERNNFGTDDPDILSCMIFTPHETAIAINYIDEQQYLKLLNDMTDFDKAENLSRMFIIKNGFFFGFMTKEHNFLWKTYISPNMAMSGNRKVGDEYDADKEGLAACAGMALHTAFNRFMYDKERLKESDELFGKGEPDVSRANNITVLRP